MADEFEERALARLRSGDKTEDIAQDFEREATTVSAAAAGLLGDRDEDVRAVAAFVLGEGQELAIDPLIGVSGLGPRERAWALQRIVTEETSLRADTVAWLEPLLGDKTVIKEGEPARICDEAYFGVRQLVAFEDAELGDKLDDKGFLALPPARRDALIAKLKTAKRFRRAAGKDD